jgi:hypothetical protein
MATNTEQKGTTTHTRPAEAREPDKTTDQTTNRETHESEGKGYTITIPSPMNATKGVIEPKHLLWFGGLAVAGAFGILQWPVAAAVGVGTVVAERFARSGNARTTAH